MLRPLPVWALVLTALIAVACELGPRARPVAHSNLDLYTPQGWTLARSLAEDGRRAASAWIRRGETMETWQQRITLHSWSLTQPREGSLHDLLSKRIRHTQMSCPGALTWRVLEDRGDSLLYEVIAKPCLGFEAHHMIGYMMQSHEQRYELCYAAKGGELSEGQRYVWMNWVQHLQSAAI